MFGHAGSPYALEQHALEGVVPFELMDEADAVPGIDLGSGAVQKTQDIIGLRQKAQADLATTTAANYGAGNKITLSGASQWSDYSGTSDPIKDVGIAEGSGAQPDRQAPEYRRDGRRRLGKTQGAPQGRRSRQRHRPRFRYPGADRRPFWRAAGGAVGDALYENDTGALADVWGKFVIVAYTEMGGIADRGKPTFGYTYQLAGYPLVEQPYQDRNAKSWIYPVTDEVAPVIAGAAGGYLISAAVA